MRFPWRRPFRSESLAFEILDVPVEIRDAPPAARAALQEVFEAFPALSRAGRPLTYRFLPTPAQSGGEGGIVIRRTEPDAELHASDWADAVFLIEKDVTIQLQVRRSELLFLHAAVLGRDGSASLLVAESGRGKSTTAWALLHHGFDFLTDEIAPIALDTLQVHPCPLALALKTLPPVAYPLPGAIARSARMRVPTSRLPARIESQPLALHALFFVDYDPDRMRPTVRRLSTSEAATRLYVSVLNALAHGSSGLDAVAEIASRVPSYSLAAAELGATCRLVEETLEGV